MMSRIVRNHRLFWTGYAEIPRLWDRLGIEMDTNYVSGALLSRSFGAYYSAPAASLPMRFMDEQWSVIDVLQQPVAASDDMEFHPGEGKSKRFSPGAAFCLNTRLQRRRPEENPAARRPRLRRAATR